MSSQEEEEYTVSDIVAHGDYEELLNQTAVGMCSLNPNNLETTKVHSKYAFLVHWRKYSVQERTWEPEWFLREVGHLAAYKRRNNLEPEFTSFEKTFDPSFCRRVKIGFCEAKDNDEEHLMTEEELKEAKIIGLEKWLEQRNAAYRQQWADEDARAERRRERESSERRRPSELTEEQQAARKKRKEEAKKRKAEREPNPIDKFKIPKKNRPPQEDVPSCSSAKSSAQPETSVPSVDTNGDDTMKHTLKQPGMHPLDLKTPKIHKKSRPSTDETPRAVQATSSVLGPHLHVDNKNPSNDNLESGSVQSSKRNGSTSSEGSSRKSASRESLVPPTLGVFKPTDVQRNCKILKNPTVQILQKTQSMEALSTAAGGKERPKALVPKKRKTTPEEQELKKLGEKLRDFQLKKEKLMKDSKKLHLKYEAFSSHRTFPHVLEQRKLRRWKSAEELPKRFDENATIELIANNYEVARGLEGPNELPAKKSRAPFQTPKIRTLKVLSDEDRIQKHRNRLFENNWKKVKSRMEDKGILQKEFHEVVMLLVKAYSFDDSNLFCKLVEKNFASSKLDAHLFTTIALIVCACDHQYWKADPDGFALVESERRRRICEGRIREQETRCSEGHRKCIWMEHFLRLLPQSYRFEENSGLGLNGLGREPDGPFRDDVFHHCMVYGAECQKNMFFRFNKPLGLVEDPDGWEYLVDPIHLLVVQHGNIHRIPRYIVEAGFDVNAFASNTRTNRVLRLHDYVKAWTKQNVPPDDEELCEYYRKVYEVIRNTAERLEMFVENHASALTFERMAGRYKCHADITLAHIIRCSPVSNVSLRSYEGTHQTLTNLFYPINHCGMRDGIETTDEVTEPDFETIESLEGSLGRFQKWVREKTADQKTYRGRAVLALFRVKIEFDAEADEKQPFVLPNFSLVKSDHGIDISQVSILRQRPGLTAEESDITLMEIPGIQSPGAHFYGVPSRKMEETLIVPGNAHLEVKAVVTEPITFVAQLFFIKRTGTI